MFQQFHKRYLSHESIKLPWKYRGVVRHGQCQGATYRRGFQDFIVWALMPRTKLKIKGATFVRGVTYTRGFMVTFVKFNSNLPGANEFMLSPILSPPPPAEPTTPNHEPAVVYQHEPRAKCVVSCRDRPSASVHKEWCDGTEDDNKIMHQYFSDHYD